MELSSQVLAQLLINGLIAGAIYSIVAIGFGLILLTSRMFCFSHAAAYTIGAYCCYTFHVSMNLPLPIGLLLACIGAAVVGAATDVLIYRRMRRRDATSLALMIASLGVYVVLQEVVALTWGDDSKSINRAVVMIGHDMFGARITDVQLTLIGAAIVVAAVATVVMRRTGVGRCFRAVSANPILARLCGIDSEAYVTYSFGWGSALAAIGGTGVAYETALTPTMGLLVVTKAAMIAGISRSKDFVEISGIALLVGLSESIVTIAIPSTWQNAVTIAVLTLLLVAVRPRALSYRVAA
jgi:branched-chain amino acid transport system permease protein